MKTVKTGKGFGSSNADQDLLRVYQNLQEQHRESFQAAETLQKALEATGLELLDTGAYYDKEGNQEGPRDLVMEVPGTDTEYAFRVHHDPRKAETDDTLPAAVAEAVAKWEAWV